MANDNPSANSLGKSRFGDPNNLSPSEAGKKSGNMRTPLRRLSRMIIEKGETVTKEKLLEMLAGEQGRLLLPDVLAVNKFMRSLDDDTAYEKLCDAVDGKLIERKIEGRAKSLAELLTGLDDIEDET